MSASALSPTLDRRHNQRCLLAGHVVVDLQWADHHVIRHGVEKQIKTTDVAPIFFACPRWPADRIMTHFRLTGRTAPRHSAMANITECSNVSKSTKVKRLRNRRRKDVQRFQEGAVLRLKFLRLERGAMSFLRVRAGSSTCARTTDSVNTRPATSTLRPERSASSCSDTSDTRSDLAGVARSPGQPFLGRGE